MAEEKKIDIKAEDKEVKGSNMVKGRKSIAYLQKLKDEGTPIVQMCPMVRDQFFVMAAEMANVDICRLTVPGDGQETQEFRAGLGLWWLRVVRNQAKLIHINYYMETMMFASKEKALEMGAQYMFAGADSLLPMGVNNETLKYMADNWLVVFGHVGALSGWQTAAQGGYKRHGKTAEDALKVMRMAYEYQENGMKAMSIELVPIEVTNAVAKKLRVPVIGVAAGGAADGSELVDFDLFNMMPNPASHAKAYADFLPWAVEAYADWEEDVRSGGYPEDKHGVHMDEKELDKFLKAIEKF